MADQPKPFTYEATTKFILDLLGSNDNPSSISSNPFLALTSLSPISSIISKKPNRKPPTDLINAMNKAGITNKLERAHILSQTAYESGEWSKKSENLNYSENGLKKLFGKYFPGNLAAQSARQPEKIANRVYANRNGNGNEASGDGWKYRGRGYIQLTGKNNYISFNNYLKRKGINDNVVKNPDLVATKYPAEASAFWWISNDLGNSSDIRSKAQVGFDSQSVIIITQIVASAKPDKNNILGKIQYFNYFKTENF